MMKKSRHPVFLAVLVVLLFLADACVRLERSHPEKRSFLLSADRPETFSPPGNGIVLRVLRFRVSPQFEGKGLLYRTGEFTYESDFYNEFLISPGSLISQAVTRWISGSGLFEHVMDSSGYTDPQYVLEGMVTALYGDYRVSGQYRAVMAIQFFLVRDIVPQPEILAHREYHEESRLEATSPDALVEGWIQALRRILIRFEHDLRGYDLQKGIPR